ncbi:MAG: diguanylate cyclase [Pseudoxanthomonas sp.]
MRATADAPHHHSVWARWSAPLVFALVSAIVAYGSFHLTRFSGDVAALWIANGMLVGALLLLSKAQWPAWMLAAFLGQLAARIAVGDAMPEALGLGLANLLECWMVAGWVRRRVDDLRDANSLGEVARDGVVAALLACAVSASLAIAVKSLMTTAGTPALTWILWFMAHLLGMVIVGTLIASIGQRGVRRSLRRGQRLDFLACVAPMLAVTAATFLQARYPLLFLPFLPLVLLAYRHGLFGMLVGTLILAVVSGLSAATDSGPFAMMHGGPLARTFFWQAYVASACLLSFATTVAVTQRFQLMRRLARSETQLVNLTEQLPAMVARFDRDARYVYANARSRDMSLGMDLIGTSLREARGEAAYAKIDGYVQGVLGGEPQSYETRWPLVDRDVELQVQFVPDRAPDGSVKGFYSLAFDITEAKRNERELARLARLDALTGLANRRQFDESLREAVDRARDTGLGLMLLSLDLDKFKDINDTLGHAVGDEVLKRFAQRLREAVYEVGMVARHGGDEFHVLIENSPRPEIAAPIAGRILRVMREPMHIGSRELHVGTSIGIGFQNPVQSGQSLMALADAALYEAKARGRGTWALLEA